MCRLLQLKVIEGLYIFTPQSLHCTVLLAPCFKSVLPYLVSSCICSKAAYLYPIDNMSV